MTPELAQLRDFLAAHAPFDTLPEADLQRTVQSLDVRYVRRQQPILTLGQPNAHLHVVRKGAVEVTGPQGALVARYGEGDSFGYPSLLGDGVASAHATAIEDTLLYQLPVETFRALRAQHADFAEFFDEAQAHRLRAALDRRTQAAELVTPVRSLLKRAPVTIPLDASIRIAAQTMAEAHVSSLLVVEKAAEEPGGPGRLFGILTDRDLRTRVLAEGRDPDGPVRGVMTPNPAVISAGALAFEALLRMTARNIHHLPVLDSGALAGIVTVTDLMRLQASSPVFIVGDIAKQTTPEGLARVAERLPDLLLRLIEADAKPRDIGTVATAVADALTERLLTLAEAKLGPPPVPYAWLALGSQARQEMNAHSDQDNALLLHDDFDPDAHDAYFEALAQVVSDGLHGAGFVYCPGDVMATNSRWRQPLAAWKRTFTTWIERPDPKAVMHTTIFFDLRHGHGDEALTRALRTHIRELARSNQIFLATLAVDALQFEPPLGFFRTFVVDRSGEHKDTFDIKTRGLAPLVDIARVYALAAGVTAVNTHDRFAAIAEAGAVNPKDATSQDDAFEYVAMTRLRHQGRQLRAAETPDNRIAPRELSRLERTHLRDAFKVVVTAQESLASRYNTAMIS
ncbi:MAG: putative nucleotidyltransferase substrate binding domain-containing protein [Bacteroidota bacterium]